MKIDKERARLEVRVCGGKANSGIRVSAGSPQGGRIEIWVDKRRRLLRERERSECVVKKKEARRHYDSGVCCGGKGSELRGFDVSKF